MTQQTIFNGDDASSTNTDSEQQQQQEHKDFLSELVGEGRKYKDVQELAKGAIHANQFIEQIQGENKDLRSELDKRLTAEDILKQAREEMQSNKAAGEENTNTPTLGKDEVEALVKSTLVRETEEQKKTANILKADAMMKERYGEKAAQVLQQKAATLGLSNDFLMDVASKSPEAFLNVLGESTQGNQASGAPNPSKGTVNTESFSTSGNSGAKDKAYYDDLRRTDPRKYFSTATQNEIFKLAQEGKYK